jgi:hypothetical protein
MEKLKTWKAPLLNVQQNKVVCRHKILFYQTNVFIAFGGLNIVS